MQVNKIIKSRERYAVQLTIIQIKTKIDFTFLYFWELNVN